MSQEVNYASQKIESVRVALETNPPQTYSELLDVLAEKFPHYTEEAIQPLVGDMSEKYPDPAQACLHFIIGNIAEDDMRPLHDIIARELARIEKN